MEYTTDCNVPSDTTPLLSKWICFSGELTNTQLMLKSNGDALKSILVDPPSDGSVVFTETQSTVYRTISFSYKASDGINESEVAQMNIEVREKKLV